MEEKIYLISDEEGNMFVVKDWDRLFNETASEDLEGIYIVTKYNYTLEEALMELENNGMIEKADDDNIAPLGDIVNSLDKMSEHIGMERIKELDDEVIKLLSIPRQPPNFLHLN